MLPTSYTTDGTFAFSGKGRSWMAAILPYIDRAPLYGKIDFNAPRLFFLIWPFFETMFLSDRPLTFYPERFYEIVLSKFELAASNVNKITNYPLHTTGTPLQGQRSLSG